MRHPRSRHSRHIPAVMVVASLAAVAATGCDKLGLSKTPPPPTPSPVPTTVASATPTPNAGPIQLPFDKNVYEQMSPLGQGARIPVIMYHDIIKQKGRGSVWFDCTVAEFKEHLKFIEEQGATPISLEQLHRHLTRGEEIPEKAIVLTFDDNYQGFYENAYPLLKAKNYPSAMFVHTNFVGDKKGAHPKMDWETLKKLDQEGLVTIASHTLSHPDDMSKLPIEDQDRELTEAKSLLEQQLGHPVPYFAYPNGKGDATTFDAAQRAGYTMAFTIVNGPAEESPGILVLNRYIHTRLKQGWEECQAAAKNAPAAVVDVPLANNPIVAEVKDFDGIKLGIIRGGQPTTWRDLSGSRKSVGEFIQEASTRAVDAENTAVAGMNGTFFADAALRGTNNLLIGPCLTTAEGTFYPEMDAYRLTRLKDRPLVMWSPKRIVIAPFNTTTMNDEAALKTFMPDVTDIFLAGAWIVHNGVPRTREEMSAYSARDFNDPRRRAFFGITDSGDVVLGGSLEVITTERLAKAAAAAGVKEAVLMDSGFSTSIVYDNKILVTGHTAKNLPSRPVPHAIVVYGKMEAPTDKETQEALSKAEPAVGEISAIEAQAQAPGPSKSSGRRRRRSSQ